MKARQLLSKLPPHLRRDGELILAHLLGRKVSSLPLLESDLSPETVRRFRELMDRRIEGVPTAYLLGEWDFYGRTFRVREGVLIPRPETELLVEKILSLIPDEGVWGFEIGCGSGCISITLLREKENLRMTAGDLNPSAVSLTLENARLHGVVERIEVLAGDMFEPVAGRKFSFVVSNPPYVPAHLWGKLPREVRREGHLSVIGGEKGYEFYERFCAEVRDYLLPGGFVALEIGHDQGKVVRDLLVSAGFEVMIYKDYAGQDRIALGWS